MTKQKSGWEKFREKETEREKEKARLGRDESELSRTMEISTRDKTQEELVKLDQLIEQTHSRVQQFVAKADKIHPRPYLETIAKRMGDLESVYRTFTQQAMLFKAQQILLKYKTYKEKWDKQLS